MSYKKEGDIRRALAERLSQAANTILYGTVKSVNEAERTCTVTVDETDYEDVLLHAVADSGKKGFCFIPAEGSTVLVSRIGGSNELLVSMFSEVDKAQLSVGDKVTAALDAERLEYANDKVTLSVSGNEVRLDADRITLNGGSLGGLIKIEELTAKVNELIDAFNSHTHPGVITAVSGGSGAPAVGTPGNTQAPATTAARFDKGDYENTKVTH